MWHQAPGNNIYSTSPTVTLALARAYEHHWPDGDTAVPIAPRLTVAMLILDESRQTDGGCFPTSRTLRMGHPPFISQPEMHQSRCSLLTCLISGHGESDTPSCAGRESHLRVWGFP